MRHKLAIFLTCLLLGVFVSPREARADAQSQLELANLRYQNGRLDDAASILRKLLAIPLTDGTPKAAQRRRVYLEARPLYVACLVLSGAESARIDATILAQYEADPYYELPALQYPQPVNEAFIRVRAKHAERIGRWQQQRGDTQQELAAKMAQMRLRRAKRIETLEKMAAEERIITTRSRWVAAMPFGIGQFQNGDVALGTALAISETLLVGGTIASAVVAGNIESTRCPDTIENETTGVREPLDCNALLNQFQAAQLVNWISFGTSAAVIVGGIIQAQVAFEEEHLEIRKRRVPPPITVKPTAAISPTGAVFGLYGTF